MRSPPRQATACAASKPNDVTSRVEARVPCRVSRRVRSRANDERGERPGSGVTGVGAQERGHVEVADHVAIPDHDVPVAEQIARVRDPPCRPEELFLARDREPRRTRGVLLPRPPAR